MLELPIEEGANRSSLMRVVGYADDAVIVCKANCTEETADMINKQLTKIYKWSLLNRVKFNPVKLAALTMSNKIVRPVTSPIYYNGELVNEVDSYKYLGVHVDNKCNWSLHITNTIAKLTLITKSLRGVACGKNGLSMDVFRFIWGWKAQSKIVCDKFHKEIRRYGLMATRYQRSTPNVLIFSLLKTKAFTHILQCEILKVSIQQFHIVQTQRQGVYENYGKNRILREIPQCMDHLYFMYRRDVRKEILDVEFDDVNEQYRVHPSEWVSTKTVIHSTERAIVMGMDKRGWVLYTDASASSYGIGWCVVVVKNGFCQSINSGSFSRCSVFMAEAYAILQAVRYINRIVGLGRKELVEIRCDAQGLVRCLEKPCFSNRLLARIKEELSIAMKTGKNVVLRWVPGHKDIIGNTYADRGAKKAVDSRALTYMYTSKDDVKVLLREREKEIEKYVWNDFSSRNIKLFLPDIDAVKKFLRSSPSVALRQVVSGHTKLNEFLCRKLGVRDSPLCKCGKGNETVHHYVFDCSLYEELRKELWEDFEHSYDYIIKDWGKLNDFVLRTKRFDRKIEEGTGDTKEE